jgi:cytoskeletal protein CcmA (bactofilin family)
MSKDKSGSRLDSLVGPETTVRGDCRVGGSLRLDGTIEGRVDVTETFLTGPRSRLKGEVHCRDAVIAGAIEGNISASETVELQTGARVFGDISSKGLIIQRDCVFEGRCTMVRPQSEASGQA